MNENESVISEIEARLEAVPQGISPLIKSVLGPLLVVHGMPHDEAKEVLKNALWSDLMALSFHLEVDPTELLITVTDEYHELGGEVWTKVRAQLHELLTTVLQERRRAAEHLVKGVGV